MSNAGNARFGCDACGKTYAWKPELAGKKAKCKCGAVIEVPASVSAPEPSLDELYSLAEQGAAQAAAVAAPVAAAGAACPSCAGPLVPGAVLCVNCGYNLVTGQQLATAAAPAGAVAPPAPPAPARAGARKGAKGAKGPKGPGRFGARSAREEAAEAAAAHAQLTELWIPMALLVVGSGLSVWRLMASGDMSVGMAMAMFAVWVLFEAVLVFVGCLVGIKWLGISLGEPAKAFLKIGAVVVGPFGAALLASWLVGTWVVGFFLAPILYYALLSWFFDMDLGEVLLLSGVIFALQYIGRLLILLTLLEALFGTVPAPVTQLAGMALFGPMVPEEEKKVDPTIVQKTAAEDDKVTADLLAEDERTQEAKEFLENENNSLSGMTRDESLALSKELYDKGAAKVLASDIGGYADKNTSRFTSGLLIVELPADATARKALVEKHNQLQPPKGYAAAKDIGQKHLRFWIAKKVTTEDIKKAMQEDADDL